MQIFINEVEIKNYTILSRESNNNNLNFELVFAFYLWFKKKA